MDASDTTLTHAFDLTGVRSATLDYWAWWEVEKNYDFAYLEVSADGEKTWQILQTPSGTNDNSTGSNLGWGYTGCSGGGDPGQGCSAQWVEEKVDLSAYAGKKIEVRFESVTDAELDYNSLMLDDISLPQINYTCDFEKDSCGWDSQGFVRVNNALPQTFVVQVIHQSGGQTTVEQMPLDSGNRGSLALNLEAGDTTVLVVAGTTPFTTDAANYQVEIK